MFVTPEKAGEVCCGYYPKADADEVKAVPPYGCYCPPAKLLIPPGAYDCPLNIYPAG